MEVSNGLPKCPYCGGRISLHVNEQEHYGVCRSCAMTGPRTKTKEEATRLLCDMKAELETDKCPFCGSERVEVTDDCWMSFLVLCRDCKAQGPLWMEPWGACELFQNRHKATGASTLGQVRNLK